MVPAQIVAGRVPMLADRRTQPLDLHDQRFARQVFQVVIHGYILSAQGRARSQDFSMDDPIPCIDIGPLFDAASRQRDLADQAIMAAAATCGFMVVRGLPADVPAQRAARANLLRLFDLPESETRKLWRQKFDPTHQNVYRGWFPLQTGFLTAKEGIDLGADIVYGASVVDGTDPLREATPLPSEMALPGWRESAAAYYRGMEKVSQALMRAIARGLSLEQDF